MSRRVVAGVVAGEEASATCCAWSGPDEPSLPATEQPGDAHHEQDRDAEHHQPADPVDAGGEPSARRSGHVGHASQRSRLTARMPLRDASLLASRLYDHEGVRPPRTAAPVVRRARARPAVASYRGDLLGRPGVGGHAPADAGGARPAGLRGLDGAVADPGRTGRLPGRRGDPRVGPARLPAARHSAPRCRGPDRRASTTAPSPTPTTRSGRYPASATTPPRPCWPSRSAVGRPCSTPTCAGCSPGW